MELYEQIFNNITEFNDYVNLKLIHEKLIIIPISVIPKRDKLQIFYTKEEI